MPFALTRADVAGLANRDPIYLSRWLRVGLGTFAESVRDGESSPLLEGFFPYESLFAGEIPAIRLPQIYDALGATRGAQRFRDGVAQVLYDLGDLPSAETRLVAPHVLRLISRLQIAEALEPIRAKVCNEGGWHRDEEIYLAAFKALMSLADHRAVNQMLCILIGPIESRHRFFEPAFAPTAAIVLLKSSYRMEDPSHAVEGLRFLEPELQALPKAECDRLWTDACDHLGELSAIAVRNAAPAEIQAIFGPRSSRSIELDQTHSEADTEAIVNNVAIAFERAVHANDTVAAKTQIKQLNTIIASFPLDKLDRPIQMFMSGANIDVSSWPTIEPLLRESGGIVRERLRSAIHTGIARVAASTMSITGDSANDFSALK